MNSSKILIAEIANISDMVFPKSYGLNLTDLENNFKKIGERP